MSLIGNIANKEIYNFLRTTSIKNSYFADQSKSRHIRSSIASVVPDNRLPYYRHVAGEYILKEAVTAEVHNPKTGNVITQSYPNTSKVYDSQGVQSVDMRNTLIYNDVDGVFDEMMYVTSLDTQEEIPFTLENLHAEYALEEGATHTKTLEAYKLPSRYYELLCERYPSQVDLIKAIVYPVQKARDVTASELNMYSINSTPVPTLTMRRIEALIEEENFAIVGYDSSVLENKERRSLLTAMNDLVTIVRTRWNVPEYAYEENYATVLWTMLWCILPIALIAQRYSNIKTPFAHSSHVWDYLISKGLESYKGYLNDDQTQFLYKNIGYILQNRGQQKVTNLLIDELLADAGLNIKCKTIALDTTSSLDTTYLKSPSSIAKQCESCDRRTVCHRNITDWQCPEYIGVDGICQAEPVVLTEEFAGANHDKIISALVSQYGYTEEKAEKKYKRSLLWKDSEIEDIREQYDRDQLVDIGAEVGSLDDLIQKEHESGLEPVYNESIVEQQTNELQHIEGTTAPTKILEITKNTYNARFAVLFNKFVTETLMHFATREGATLDKVNNIYEITLDKDLDPFSLTYGNALALLYLGTIHQDRIELFFDHCNKDEIFEEGHAYFRALRLGEDGTETEEALTMSNANRLTRIDISSLIGKRVDDYSSLVYRWAPKFVDEEYCPVGGLLPAIDGHEVITEFINSLTYNFPIPDQAQLHIAFKFGKPIKQEALIDAWYAGDTGDHRSLMPTDADKSLVINDIPYAVKVAYTLSTDKEFVAGKTYYEKTSIKDVFAKVTDAKFILGKDYYEFDLDEEEASIWEWSPIKLRVLGLVKNEAYFSNDGEIPIIPKYGKWFCDHLQPDAETYGYTRTVTVIHDLPFDTDTGTPHPERSTATLRFDTSKSSYYQNVEVGRFIDVDELINAYPDTMENISELDQIGSYITTMFAIYEKIYSFVGQSGSIKTNIAAQAVFDAIRCNRKYRVDLTKTVKNTEWPDSSVLKYTAEDGSTSTVSTFDNWLKVNRTLYDTCRKLDSESTWETAITTILNALLSGCTSVYWASSQENAVVEKLKELVTHLSSYKVNFINVAASDKAGDCGPAIVTDDGLRTITESHVIYSNAVGDELCTPHCGGLFTASTGYLFAYTRDRQVVKGKTYYQLDVEHDQTAQIPPIREMPLSYETYTFNEALLEEGADIPPLTYFEMVELYSYLGISDTSKRLEVSRHNGKWCYRLGEAAISTDVAPASSFDATETTYDTFLDLSVITTEARKKLKCKVYRKEVDKTIYEWGGYVESEKLKELFTNHVMPTYIEDVHKISSDAIDSNELKLTVEIGTQDGRTIAFIYKDGEIQEPYDVVTATVKDPMSDDGRLVTALFPRQFIRLDSGEMPEARSEGYLNAYGRLSTCDCGRCGPDAFKMFKAASYSDIWDPHLTQSNGAWGNFQNRYWRDPYTDEVYQLEDNPIYRFLIDTSAGKLEHEPDGEIGDVCTFCKTKVIEGKSK